MALGAIAAAAIGAAGSVLASKDKKKAAPSGGPAPPALQGGQRARPEAQAAPPPAMNPQQVWGGLSPTLRRGILEMQQSVAMEALADEEIRSFGKPGRYNAMVQMSRDLLRPEGRY
jgi:hypothetical protein